MKLHCPFMTWQCLCADVDGDALTQKTRSWHVHMSLIPKNTVLFPLHTTQIHVSRSAYIPLSLNMQTVFLYLVLSKVLHGVLFLPGCHLVRHWRHRRHHHQRSPPLHHLPLQRPLPPLQTRAPLQPFHLKRCPY